MPVFTISFCAVIVAVYLLDTFFLLPEGVTVSRKEKLLTGHNRGRLNRALRLSDEKIRKGEVLKQGTESIGAHTKAKIVKNKVAPPFRVAECDIMYGDGVSREGCVLDMAAELDVVKKSGSWYSYEGTRLGQGRDAVKEMLKADRKLYDELSGKVLAALAAQAEEAEQKAQAKRAKIAEAVNAEADGEA